MLLDNSKEWHWTMIAWWEPIAAPSMSYARHCGLPMPPKNAQGCIPLTLPLEIFKCLLLMSVLLHPNHSRSGIVGTNWMVQYHYCGVSMQVQFCCIQIFMFSPIWMQYCCIQKCTLFCQNWHECNTLRHYPFSFSKLNENNFLTGESNAQCSHML